MYQTHIPPSQPLHWICAVNQHWIGSWNYHPFRRCAASITLPFFIVWIIDVWYMDPDSTTLFPYLTPYPKRKDINLAVPVCDFADATKWKSPLNAADNLTMPLEPLAYSNLSLLSTLSPHCTMYNMDVTSLGSSSLPPSPTGTIDAYIYSKFMAWLRIRTPLWDAASISWQRRRPFIMVSAKTISDQQKGRPYSLWSPSMCKPIPKYVVK